MRYIAVYTTSLDCRRHKQLYGRNTCCLKVAVVCSMAMGCCLQAVPSPPRATGLARREEQQIHHFFEKQKEKSPEKKEISAKTPRRAPTAETQTSARVLVVCAGFGCLV